MNFAKNVSQQNYTYCQFLRALSDVVLQNREQNFWLKHAASTGGNYLVISDAVVKARIHTGFHRFILINNYNKNTFHVEIERRNNPPI